MKKQSDADVSVRKAGRWLTHSGIQNASRDSKLSGGVAAWYELETKIYPFLYSEITGYALSTYLFLHRITGDDRYITSAHAAARWLIKNALLKNGGIKTRFYLVKHYVSGNYCFHYGRVYAFDTAMVGYGLLQLYRYSQKAEYGRACQSIFRFLSEEMRTPDGLFHPYYDTVEKQKAQDLSKWSDQSGTFHAKHALFFVDYFEIFGDRRAKEITTKMLDASVALQKRDGRFITARKDGSTHLHPHAYTIEGLLYGGIHFEREDWMESALKGFKWMQKGVSKDGSVSSIYEGGTFSHHERSDIVAQTLRIGSVLYGWKPSSVRKYLPALEAIRNHLLLFQHPSGGFVYGAATDGMVRGHLNAWATMFALQALWMHDEFVIREEPLQLDAFV